MSVSSSASDDIEIGKLHSPLPDSAMANETDGGSGSGPSPDSAAVLSIEDLSPVAISTSPASTSTDLAVLDALYQSLVDRFCPRIYLNEHEQYLPCTPEFYYAQCDLYHEDLKIADKGKFTAETLGNEEELNRLRTLAEEAKNGGAPSPYLISGPEAPPPYRAEPPLSPTDRGQWFNMRCSPSGRGGCPISDLPEMPLHARVIENEKEDCYEIIYLFFYCFNGAYNVFGRQLGAHDGDIEHVRMKVDRQSKRLRRVFFGSHGYKDGYWKRAADIEIEDETHPRVFIADHSHGVYASSGIFFRICCCANDRTSAISKAIRWSPKRVILLQPPSNPRFPAWLNYRFNYCIDGIGAPIIQEWWINGDPNTSNSCCRRTCFSFIDPKCGLEPEFWCLKAEPLDPDEVQRQKQSQQLAKKNNQISPKNSQ